MNSQLVVFALVVLCGVLNVNGSASKAYIQSRADQSLMNTLIKSRAGGSDQVACFEHYNPELNQHLVNFEKGIAVCDANAKSQTEALNELGTESRDDITNASNNVCSQFQKCQLEANNLDFFDCYSNSGDASVRQVYVNSQNASVSAADFRAMKRQIDDESERCKNRTENAYVTNTANTYESLVGCLQGGINWTDAPSTEAPATEAPATEAPATEAPATDAPATEAPATEAPATEAPATEAPATEAPATEAPATEAPATEAPATEAPATEAPATEAPANEVTSTEAPATEAPATEAPVTTEADQVEELQKSNARSRLQQLVSSWGKRFA